MDLIDVVAEMVDSGKDLTRDGTPEVAALGARLGYRVTAKFRDDAFGDYQVRKAMRANFPVPKKVVPFKKVKGGGTVGRGGLTGWRMKR